MYLSISETMKQEHSAIGRDEIMNILENVGVFKGMILYVDANIQHVPYTIGGIQTWISCLMEKVGFEGTIVMPSFTFGTLDPSSLKEVSRDLYPRLREGMHPYHKKLSKVSEVGSFSDVFLDYESVYRSSHPVYSFAAWGKYAKMICEKHPLHFALSKHSPLGKIYELGAFVLLIGKTYSTSSALHLSRYMDKSAIVKVNTALIAMKSKPQWKAMLEVELSNAEYQVIGELLEKNGVVNTYDMRTSETKLFSLREIIQLAARYMNVSEEEII